MPHSRTSRRPLSRCGGKDRYVVMDLEAYNRLRVCELEAALVQARREIAEGKGIEESVDQHLARLQEPEP